MSQQDQDSGNRGAATRAAGDEPSAAPAITFSSFVIGLASQAVLFLDPDAAPGQGTGRRDPAEAAAIIDVLDMLARKTKGNLTEDESKLTEEVLYDLRMRYVRATRQGPGRGGETA